MAGRAGDITIPAQRFVEEEQLAEYDLGMRWPPAQVERRDLVGVEPLAKFAVQWRLRAGDSSKGNHQGGSEYWLHDWLSTSFCRRRIRRGQWFDRRPCPALRLARRRIRPP